MDDNEVCPLCCEELDISDKQFFPCKCGYQVCMWCWHRIRETESGLCPACRTPYGDDPHEFSAVDVQEVLKANKEKAAAERREKDRQKHSVPPPVKIQHHHSIGGTVSGTGSGIPSFSHVAAGDGIGVGGSGVGVTGGIGTVGPGGHFLSAAAVAAAENAVATPLDNSSGIIHFGGPDNKTTTVIDRSRSLDPPKDRSSLANMRVIRRTLVYAVGLPQDCATEHQLNKPDYFGQYGKISKIVVNKNYNGNGDPRRASASVYVTFVHKEDALACILALDGFVLDGRHIRASFGTSKYCSAFIKNVRCSNPECTYLHHLGLPEDSFTKQEILAGYVTSGRDVLAKQQAAMAIAASANGRTRKRVGGGGPSGTGTATSHPVLPAPEYDEPVRTTKSGSSFVAPPVGVKHGRSISVGASPATSAPNSGNAPSGFAAVAAGAASSGNSGSIAPAPIPITKIRPPAVVASLSSKPTPAVSPAPAQAPAAAVTATSTKTSAPATTSAGSASTNASTTSSLAPTAASVVASAKTSSPPSVPPPPHTTLTSLTPLKRSTSLPGGKSPPPKNISAPTATTSATATPSKASAAYQASTANSIPAAITTPATPAATTATPSTTTTPASTPSTTTIPASTAIPSATTTAQQPDKTATVVAAPAAESKASGAGAVSSAAPVATTAAPKAIGAIGSSRKQVSNANATTATSAVSIGSSRSGGEDNSLDSAKSSLEGDVIGGTAIFGSGILSQGSTVLSNVNGNINCFSKAPGPSLLSTNNSFGAIGPTSSSAPQHQSQNMNFGAIGSSYGTKGVIGEKAAGSTLSSGSDWKSGDVLLSSSSGEGGGLWGSVGSSPKHDGISVATTKNSGIGVIGSSRSPSNKAPGGDLLVGGPSLGGNSMGGVLGRDSGTTALASMLGISLPAQGSGSLRDTLHNQNNTVNAPRPDSFSFSSVPIGGLNESKNAQISQQTSPWPNEARGVIGSGGAGTAAGVGVIGGLNHNLHYQPAPIGTRSPIGRSPPPQALHHHDNVIGGGPLIGGPSQMTSNRAPGAGRPNTNQEIALLQSLLPGVHVTASSGGNPPPFSSMGQQHLGHVGWNAAPGPRVVGAPSVIGSGRQSSFGGGVIGVPNHGTIGEQNPAAWAAAPGGGFYGHQQADHRPQQHRQGGNIW